MVLVGSLLGGPSSRQVIAPGPPGSAQGPGHRCPKLKMEKTGKNDYDLLRGVLCMTNTIHITHTYFPTLRSNLTVTLNIVGKQALILF